MGELLMSATVFKTVAKALSQLSQPLSTLRQCDSCPYPFRDRAPTVALSQRGCWREKRSVANYPSATPAPLSGRGFRPRRPSTANRCHPAVCNEIENPGRPIASEASEAAHAIGIAVILNFWKSSCVLMLHQERGEATVGKRSRSERLVEAPRMAVSRGPTGRRADRASTKTHRKPD
jgi:hypothetical protein